MDEMRLSDPAGLARAVEAAVPVERAEDPVHAPGPRFEVPRDVRAVAAVEEIRPEHAPSRRWRLVAAIALVAIAAVGVVGWRVVDARAEAQAYEQLVDVRSDLNKQIEEAEYVLQVSEGRVSDQGVRDALQEAVAQARTAGRNADAATGSRGASRGTRERATEVVTEAAASLQTAVAAVRAAQDTWDLDQAKAGWRTAQEDLAAAIDAATAALLDSEGQVADEIVRTSLSAAIERAAEVRDRQASTGTVSELTAVTEQAVAAVGALAAPTQAVRDAQAAWATSQVTATPTSTGEEVKDASSVRQSQPPTPDTPAASQSTSRESAIDPGAAWNDPRVPGQVSVSATTVGVTGPVVVTVGSVSQVMGTGSGTFTAAVSGLPAGAYPWSVSADGMVASGTTLAVVP